MKVKEKKLKLKEGCTECDKKDRLIAIQAIIAGIPYRDDKARTEALKSFYDANLTLEEIDVLTRPMKNATDYRNTFNKRTGVY